MPRWLKIVVIVVVVLAVVAGLVDWFLHGSYFRGRIAALTAQQIEHASGLHAQFGRLRLGYRPLSANLYDVVIRGREPANAPPLAEIPHIYVRLRIASLRPLAIKITELDWDQPRIHVYRLPDGEWNLPRPPVVVSPPAEPLFDLGLEKLRLSDGWLDFADRTFPLDATLEGMRLRLERRGGAFAGLFAFRRGVIRGSLPRAITQQASLRFTIWPNDVRIDDLRWTANGSRFAATGMLRDLAAPQLELHYRAEIALAAWRRDLPRVTLPSGTVTVEGDARWSGREWAANGRFQAAALRWTGPYATAGSLAAQGSFAAGPRGLELPALVLRGAGGEGTARAQLARWRILQASLRLHGFRLKRLLHLAARVRGQAASLPPLAGAVTARIAARVDLRAPARWSASGAVTITPPPAPAAGAVAPLPVAADVGFHLRPRAWSLAVRRLIVVSPSMTLRASGTADSTGSSLQVALASEDLAAWRPYLAPYLPVVPGVAGTPPLHGRLRLEATLTGSLTQPIAHAALSLTGFHYGPIGADQLDAIATVTPATARLGSLRWRLGGQTFAASGEIGLGSFRPTAQSPLDFNVQGHGLSLAQLERWTGLDWPIAGDLSVTLAVSGTFAAPSASGEARLTAGRMWGQQVTSVAARVAISAQGLSSPHFVAVLAGGRITGQAQYDWQARTYRLSAVTAALQLAGLAALQSPQLALSGQISGQLRSHGSLAHPAGSATLDAINLRGAGESLGTLHLDVRADGAVARLEAALGLPNGRLTLAGSVAESRPYALDARAQLTDYDIDVWLRRFTHARLTGHSRISGQITVQGPLDHADELAMQASFDPIHLSLESVTLRNAGPVRLGLAHGVLSLARARLVGPDTDFRFAGEARLAAPGTLRGAVDGHVNLAIIHALHLTTHAAGTLTLAASLGGTWRRPAVNGTLAVRDASLAEEDLPVAFDHIEGALRFTDERVEVVRLTAATGGGEISIAGSAARAPTGFAVNLETTGKNLRIRYQGISATGNLELRLTGQRGSGLLSGQVELTRVAVAPNFDFAFFLADRRASAPSLTSNSLLDKIHLDVRLTTGPQVEVATGAARLQFQADLRARGTLANPLLLGRASVSEGEIRFAGNEYTISKGDVTFSNPFRTQPVIDFGLTTTVQQYDITLNISGPVDKLNITYRSDPPLSSRDIVGLLATGQTQESQAAANQESSSTFVGQGEQLLGLALDNVLQSRLERMFGVTQIQVNPASSGLLGTGQATVTVAQQVSRNLKVTYTQNLATSSQDIVQVEWTISRHFGVTVSRDQFGLYGISFHFRHRAR